MKELNYSINLNTLSWEAYRAISELDKSWVGTKNYIGLDYFWAYEYRHYLRNCTVASRKKVHQKMLEAGLKLDEESDEHLKIILKFAKGYPKELQ